MKKRKEARFYKEEKNKKNGEQKKPEFRWHGTPARLELTKKTT